MWRAGAVVLGTAWCSCHAIHVVALRMWGFPGSLPIGNGY